MVRIVDNYGRPLYNLNTQTGEESGHTEYYYSNIRDGKIEECFDKAFLNLLYIEVVVVMLSIVYKIFS